MNETEIIYTRKKTKLKTFNYVSFRFDTTIDTIQLRTYHKNRGSGLSSVGL